MSEISRKIFHASSGIVIAALIYYLGPVFFESFAVCLIFGLIMIHLLKSKGYSIPIIDSVLNATGRGKDFGDMSLYFILGSFMAALFFDKTAVAVSVIVLAISDSLASLIGMNFGRHKIYGKKTLEGSLAFFISAFLIVNYFYGFFTALIAALILTPIELFAGFSDNIAIPPAGSLIIQIVSRFL